MNLELLQEQKRHGDIQYPAARYEMHCAAGEPLLYLHWHEELEFLYVTAGQAILRIGLQDYVVNEGEAVFINSGELHSGKTAGDVGCSFIAFVFHGELLASRKFDRLQVNYIDPILQRKHRVPVFLTPEEACGSEVLPWLRTLLAINEQQQTAGELQTKGLLYLILASFYMAGSKDESAASTTAHRHRTERLKSALQYIQERYDEKIRLRELAQACAMSEAYFCRFFKEMTGSKPMDYVNQYRVQKAAALLAGTSKKMTEVALDVGFQNPSYFIGVFKKQYGCTPSQYQKRV